MLINCFPNYTFQISMSCLTTFINVSTWASKKYSVPLTQLLSSLLNENKKLLKFFQNLTILWNLTIKKRLFSEEIFVFIFQLPPAKKMSKLCKLLCSKCCQITFHQTKKKMFDKNFRKCFNNKFLAFLLPTLSCLISLIISFSHFYINVLIFDFLINLGSIVKISWDGFFEQNNLAIYSY